MGYLKIYKYCFAGGYNVAIIAKNKKKADEIYESNFIDHIEDWNLLTVWEHKIESDIIISPDEYCLNISKKADRLLALALHSALDEKRKNTNN